MDRRSVMEPKRSHGATGPYYPRNRTDPEAVRQGIADGRSCRQIARDLGTSYMTIYRTADKVGVQARRGKVLSPMTLRHAVEDMRPADALEYALAAYEDLAGQVGDPPALAPVPLSPQQATIFALLHRCLGQTVRFGAILAVVDAAAGSVTASPPTLKVQITHLRNRLAGHFTITNVWGVGYRMDNA